MRRREFIAALGGAVVTWPGAADAQQDAVPVIGFLHAQPFSLAQHHLTAFRKALNEMGFVEGQSLRIEYRTADGDYSKLSALATELVSQRVAVIATTGGTPVARVAVAATKTIPVVFTTGGDPVKLGFVSSFNRPGGNATGVSVMTTTLEPKRLELLREVVPGAKVIAFLANPSNLDFEVQVQDVQAAARSVGQQIAIFRASTEHDLEEALAKAVGQQVGALVVANDVFFLARRAQLVKIVARYGMPAIYAYREYVDEGGLMSYATSLVDTLRQVGLYTGRILKGEKPADLPILRPTKFELVINLKAAQALGLDISQALQQRADEVIE
jgi:putative tryptophan/tyrosine transport system substrate-binding protein